MIYWIMNDKDAHETLSILSSTIDLLILTRADSPRSRLPNQLLADVPGAYDGSRF
jgi:folylpolyglutamate synthase/dihydropteroate synthase